MTAAEHLRARADELDDMARKQQAKQPTRLPFLEFAAETLRDVAKAFELSEKSEAP